MSTRPRMHGVSHVPGGPDPIPLQILVTWSGSIPVGLGTGVTWRIPYGSNGAALALAIQRAFVRIETATGSTTSFRFELAPGGDVAFVPTTITTVDIPAGEYETDVTDLAVTITSGDLVRIVFVAGAAGTSFDAQLVGAQSS